VFCATAVPMLIGAMTIFSMGRFYGHARIEEHTEPKTQAATAKA
jgi:hypothetical protein